MDTGFGLGLLSAAVGGAGLAWPREELLAPVAGGQPAEPETLLSAGGLLQVRLEAAHCHILDLGDSGMMAVLEAR